MLRPTQAVALCLTGALTIAAARPILQEGMPEMPKPTEEHGMLQKSVGQWEGTVTMFVPGVPETPVPATETVVAAGPFWTQSHFKSDFMGQAYEGRGHHGYDPTTGQFVSTWIDNMSSYLSVMRGGFDKETKTLTSNWEAPDMTGKMAPHKAKQVFRDNNSYRMTFFTSGEKTMVIDMKRATRANPAEAGSRR